MESLIAFISEHAHYAPWVIGVSILLAGMNLPISIDILLVFSAFMSATANPEMTYPLYFIIFFCSIFSAWIAYFIGRSLHRFSFLAPFRKIVTDKKLAKMQTFYDRYGAFVYIVGRFIPFGVRNVIFISSGMSQVKFTRFALFDAIGCFLWSSLFYTLFFHLSANFSTMLETLKAMNIFIFVGFIVTLLGVFCYKYLKRKKQQL